MSRNSELNALKKIRFVGEISNKLTNGLFGTKVYKTLESCWESLLTILQWANTTSVISTNVVHFHRFCLWLFYFQCFQVILLFQVLKVQECINF